MKLSIVLPAHNEQGNVSRIYSRIRQNIAGYQAEIIFVDDGSQDGTAAEVRSLQVADPTVRLLRLTRNFGHQAALLAGLQAATGDAVITMDCDLQHPPEFLSRMVEEWQKGAPVVEMIRQDTEGATWFKKWTSAGFYRFLQLLSESPIIPGMADFQLLDKDVVKALLSFRDRRPFLRGLVGWLGFPVHKIEYVAAARNTGNSSYSVRKMLRLSLDAVTGLSSQPLRWSFYLGMCSVMMAIVYAGYALITYSRGKVVPGWTSIVMTVLFLGAIQLLSLGIIGEYIARIYDQTRHIPSYVIAEDSNVPAGGADTRALGHSRAREATYDTVGVDHA